nr:NADH dehydrogenase subunit 2 [Peltonotellus sp.]
MLLKSSKMMFLSMIFISTIMMLSSNNLMFSWMSMEINLISFLPIIIYSKKTKDQPMKYFIIQSLSSSMMLMSILLNSKTETPINLSIMMMVSMLMKMGMIPFHLWLPSMMKSLTWENCFLFTTWQKISPTILISQMFSMKEMILPMIFSLLFSPISMMKTTSTKKIMGFSSINNSPWMISSMILSKNIFMMFITVYTTINFMIMNNFMKSNIMFINQINEKDKNMKLSMIINFISISGMPPMMGFFPKWMILQKMIELSKLISMMMIISSFLTTMIYMKMIMTLMSSMTLKKKNFKKKSNKNMDISLNMLGMSVFLMMNPN